ncbi:MAG: EamA family transporter [Deltaproteobacteria bacterium]|nr:EamA family transporter [Nannocystaceae bacterium]
MLGSVVAFAVMNAFVKDLRDHGFGTLEVMFWRSAPGLPLLWLELRLRGLPMGSRRRRVVALRTLFGCLAMATNFRAVRQLALVQHTIIHLTQPVLVAIVSPSLLRERLRGAAFVALLLALVGAIAVLLPPELLLHAGESVAIGAVAMPLVPGFIGLLSACASSLAHVMLRSATAEHGLGRDRETPADAPETVVLHFTAVVSIGSLALGLALGGFSGLPGGMSFGSAAWRVSAMAALGWLGQLMMSRAYARAEAPAIAVVAYAGIPVAALIDAWVWGAELGWSTLLGAAIMVTAGWLLARARS